MGDILDYVSNVVALCTRDFQLRFRKTEQVFFFFLSIEILIPNVMTIGMAGKIVFGSLIHSSTSQTLEYMLLC